MYINGKSIYISSHLLTISLKNDDIRPLFITYDGKEKPKIFDDEAKSLLENRDQIPLKTWR